MVEKLLGWILGAGALALLALWAVRWVSLPTPGHWLQDANGRWYKK